MGRAKRFGHSQFDKGRMKGDGLEIYTAQTPKHLDECLALLEKIRKTFTDSILDVMYKHNYHILDIIR